MKIIRSICISTKYKKAQSSLLRKSTWFMDSLSYKIFFFTRLPFITFVFGTKIYQLHSQHTKIQNTVNVHKHLFKKFKASGKDENQTTWSNWLMTKFCIIICDLCGKSCLLFVTWPDRINVTMQTLFTARAAQRAQVTDILSFMFTIISLSLSTELRWKTRLIWLQKLLSVVTNYISLMIC